MILRINRLKDFGIFRDFAWDATINTFKKRNLFFGWNYTGKTTLSKLFNNLEKKAKAHFPSSEFSLLIDPNSETITQDQLDNFPHFVKVLNSVYVKNVFSWDREKKEGIEPILFYLGDEAGTIQPKIDKLKDRWNPKIYSIKQRNDSIVLSFADYSKDNGKFSKQATEIRKYLNDQLKSNDFNKSHFILLIDEIKQDFSKYILDEIVLTETREKALAVNDFTKQKTDFLLNTKNASIAERIKEILEDSAPKAIPFPELDSNENLFNWVQQGLGFHTESIKCKFCDNDLKKERMIALNQYYSEKLKEIQDSIKNVRREINQDIGDLNIEFPHESNIAKHLREKFLKAVDAFNGKRKQYLQVHDLFEQDLKKKESNYFNPIDVTVFPAVTLQDEIQNINSIIEEHNQFVESFDSEKQKAVEILLRHYVSEYLVSEDYIEKETANNISIDIVKRCRKKIQEINNEITHLESLLKNTVKGQEELNIYLKILLDREDIVIAIEDEKFVLKRGADAATNLSEGEKTAIAFSYFLTELKSLKKEGKLKETIIFIDDPISSLDSNHIFQVRSLLQHFFKEKDEYLQLFISTHNFEFFSVLLDSNLFKNENKIDVRAEKCPYYLLNRIQEDNSTIKNLPKSLRSHKSEYAHIFSILKEYNDSTDKDTFEFKILLPNALRRFLELYTLFKYPKGFTEVDDRIKIVFSPDDGLFHNTKLYHWFSHQNQFEKVAAHDSKLVLIDDAIREVLKHIEENDKLHWKGLTEVN